MLSHHWGDCWHIMLIMSWEAFYLTAWILSCTKWTSIVVSLSLRKRELLITAVKRSISWHFIFQSSVLSWMNKGVNILSSIISGENFFIRTWNLSKTPTANLLFFMKDKMIGKIYSFMRAGESTSIKPTMFYERASWT